MGSILSFIGYFLGGALLAAGTYKVADVVFPRIGRWFTELRDQVRYDQTGNVAEWAEARRADAR